MCCPFRLKRSAAPSLFRQLLIVHGFMEHSYCDQIIEATREPTGAPGADVDKHHLKRSTMGSNQETSDQRTSSTAWLHEDKCPLPLRTFAARTAALCGLPPSNMENLQVVRYQPGEQFQVHTDHLDRFVRALLLLLAFN